MRPGRIPRPRNLLGDRMCSSTMAAASASIGTRTPSGAATPGARQGDRLTVQARRPNRQPVAPTTTSRSAPRPTEVQRELPVALSRGPLPSSLVARAKIGYPNSLSGCARPTAPGDQRDTEMQCYAIGKRNPASAGGTCFGSLRMPGLLVVDLGRRDGIHAGTPHNDSAFVAEGCPLVAGGCGVALVLVAPWRRIARTAGARDREGTTDSSGPLDLRPRESQASSKHRHPDSDEKTRQVSR